mmetsp:Transcript_32789/g.74001  ORF Transcript_32789/g.74001 Transcript_32789/m.74001 type:complete len:244 (-) Transcript_32789:1596-2327(-)
MCCRRRGCRGGAGCGGGEAQGGARQEAGRHRAARGLPGEGPLRHRRQPVGYAAAHQGRGGVGGHRRDRIIPVRHRQGQGLARRAQAPRRPARRSLRGGGRDQPDDGGRGQVHHHHRRLPGPRSHPRQKGGDLHPAAFAGPHLWRQGWRGGRRLLTGGPDGDLQLAPHGRHPRHHRRQQSARRGDRYAPLPRGHPVGRGFMAAPGGGQEGLLPRHEAEAPQARPEHDQRPQGLHARREARLCPP